MINHHTITLWKSFDISKKIHLTSFGENSQKIFILSTLLTYYVLIRKTHESLGKKPDWPFVDNSRRIRSLNISPWFNRSCLVYRFSLRFSGSKFLINLRRQFRVPKICSCTWNVPYTSFCDICSLFILCLKFLFRKCLLLGFHPGNDIHRPRRANLVASNSSPKVRRQSVPTTCAHSVLNSSSSTKRFY